MSPAGPVGFLLPQPFDAKGSTLEETVSERLADVLQQSTDHDKLGEVITLQLEHGRQLGELREHFEARLDQVARQLGISAENAGRYADERTFDRMQRTRVEQLLTKINAQLGNGHAP